MTRLEKAEEIKRLVALGWSHALVAKQMGLSRGGVRNLLYDPDGSKQKARRERYRRPCPLCGKKMSGDGGFKTQPRYCSDCTEQLSRRPLIHGTASGFNKGCRCRDCRDGQAARMRDYYKRKPSKRKKKSPEVAAAHRMLAAAIKNGLIVPPTRCAECGALERGRKGKHEGGRWLHAHHTDYSQPLDVIFVCPPCHKAIHKSERPEVMLSSEHV